MAKRGLVSGQVGGNSGQLGVEDTFVRFVGSPFPTYGQRGGLFCARMRRCPVRSKNASENIKIGVCVLAWASGISPAHRNCVCGRFEYLEAPAMSAFCPYPKQTKYRGVYSPLTISESKNSGARSRAEVFEGTYMRFGFTFWFQSRLVVLFKTISKPSSWSPLPGVQCTLYLQPTLFRWINITRRKTARNAGRTWNDIRTHTTFVLYTMSMEMRHLTSILFPTDFRAPCPHAIAASMFQVCLCPSH